MENLSDALRIAAGVLIAILVIVVVVYVWRQIGYMEDAKDDNLVSLNKAEFNKAFLAYDKNLMYGTDVLSCLNKAQNNNQRYVYNNYYGVDSENIDAAARTEYFIDVEVVIHSTLSERLNVYYRNSSGILYPVVGLTSSPSSSDNFGDKLFDGGANHFNIPNVVYYYFENGRLIKDTTDYATAMWTGGKMNRNRTIRDLISDSSKLETGFSYGSNSNYITYHLLSGAGIENATSSSENKRESARLSALLSTVTLMESTILNPETPSAYDDSDWYSATWKTAAYDFKTRKFKCTGVEYNSDTGYINKISFEEIDS
jgi:hypothetical protein